MILVEVPDNRGSPRWDKRVSIYVFPLLLRYLLLQADLLLDKVDLRPDLAGLILGCAVTISKRSTSQPSDDGESDDDDDDSDGRKTN